MAVWLQREAILRDRVNGCLQPCGFQATRLGIGGFDTRRLQTGRAVEDVLGR